MPFGSSKTGRKTPNTPGSMIDAEESTGTPITKGAGDPARTAARIRRHRSHHENTKAPQPIVHTAIIIGTTSLADRGERDAGIGLGKASATNGSFTCSTMIGTR